MNLKLEHFNGKLNLEKQRQLFADAFPEAQHSSMEDYNWLMHGYPNEKKQSFEYCAFYNDEMVGYYSAIPFRYKIGNAITDVGMVCGVMTSSNYRGKGIFTQLGKFSTEDLSNSLPFTTGYPISKAVIPGHLKVGWKIAFELPLFIKFIKLNSLIKSKMPKFCFLAWILNPLLKLYNNARTTKQVRHYKTTMCSEIDEISDYDLFVKEWLETLPNALLKDTKFAKWRYGRPEKKYYFLVVRDNNKLIGFTSYCKEVKQGVPSFCLLDLCVLPGYSDCLGVLYRRLYDEAEKNGIEAIMLMNSRYSARKYKLIENGFVKSPFVFSLIINNLTNKFSDDVLMKEENWHLMWVDSDDL